MGNVSETDNMMAGIGPTFAIYLMCYKLEPSLILFSIGKNVDE
jgi:hypothetical protein